MIWTCQAPASKEVSLIFAVDSTGGFCRCSESLDDFGDVAVKPGINNGVWLLKNTAWSHDFLYRWWHSDILQGPGKESFVLSER